MFSTVGSNMHRIKYKHWKDDNKIYEIEGKIIHNNPQSDRLVIQLFNNHLEDIIKSTIVEMEEIKEA
jgi:hypothetical protein